MKKLLLSLVLPVFFAANLNAQDVPPQSDANDVCECPGISLKPLYDFLEHNIVCAEHLMSLTHGKKSQEHLWWFYYGQSVTSKNLQSAVKMYHENRDLSSPWVEKKSKKHVDDYSIDMDNPSFN